MQNFCFKIYFPKSSKLYGFCFLSSSTYVRGRDGGGMVIAFLSFFKVLGHPRETEKKAFFPTLFLFAFHSCRN